MKPLTVLAILVGIAFLAIAVVYATTEARSLPAIFPGHDPTIAAPHMKHAVAAVLLGLGCFVLAWFSTGPRSAKQQ
jgi:hypothetical protein